MFEHFQAIVGGGTTWVLILPTNGLFWIDDGIYLGHSQTGWIAPINSNSDNISFDLSSL